MDFRELSDNEIDRLDDARLLAYIAAARDAGKGDTAAMQGVRHLIFRHMGSVTARVRRKLPAHLVEEVAADAMVEAIASAFAGATIKEFHAWLNTIVRRAIADFYRGPKGRQLALDKEGAMRATVDEEGEDIALEIADEGGYGVAEVEQLIDALMAERADEHRRVIDMLVWGGYSAREAAAATGLAEANCYQIVSRFRADLRAALESDTDLAP